MSMKSRMSGAIRHFSASYASPKSAREGTLSDRTASDGNGTVSTGGGDGGAGSGSPVLNDRLSDESERDGDVFGDELDASFVRLYLSGHLRKRTHPPIHYGTTGVDLPVFDVAALGTHCLASYSGPDGGLTKVSCLKNQISANIANLDDELVISTDFSHDSSLQRFPSVNDADDVRATPAASPTDVPSTSEYDWSLSHERAFGLSVSLYERNPLSDALAGSPIADVFAVCCRENSAVLALADGVNWGEKAQLAARCAIRGSVDYLNRHLFDPKCQVHDTSDIFHILLGAFHAGHQLILQEGGAFTTLCVVVVCPLMESDQWVACACNVGDSLAFVYSKTSGVRELTCGSHDLQQMRDMRDAGGALGPVNGINPELQNLTCSLTVVDPGDVVFITSDGISDNCDPVVGKFCIPNDFNEKLAEDMLSQQLMVARNGYSTVNGSISSRSDASKVTANRMSTHGCIYPEYSLDAPAVTSAERHELMLLRMEDILRHGAGEQNPVCDTAKDLCFNLVQFATMLTKAKRRVLEDPELYKRNPKTSNHDIRVRRRMVRCKVMELPGKLDHASVVAYTVGMFQPRPTQVLVPNGKSADQVTISSETSNPSTTAEIESVAEDTLFTSAATDAEVSLTDDKSCDVQAETAVDLNVELSKTGTANGNVCGSGQQDDNDVFASSTTALDSNLNLRAKKMYRVQFDDVIQVSSTRRKHQRASPMRHTVGVDRFEFLRSKPQRDRFLSNKAEVAPFDFCSKTTSATSKRSMFPLRWNPVKSICASALLTPFRSSKAPKSNKIQSATDLRPCGGATAIFRQSSFAKIKSPRQRSPPNKPLLSFADVESNANMRLINERNGDQSVTMCLADSSSFTLFASFRCSFETLV